jgi:dipeptidyl aminopeptidase/acylaminoacyl peptidase
MAAAYVAPYGSWKSPINSDLIVSEMIRLGQIVLDGSDIYWLESRPKEGGRYVIVRHTPDGQMYEINPPPYNVRNRVHEYGGGSFVADNGTVYFSNFDDQRLYRQKPGGEPQPMTSAGGLMYADGVIDRQRNRMICICEDHSWGDREAVNTIVSLSLDGSGVMETLVSGYDFYASPRLSPDGKRLAWLAWNHPNMPWDGCELWLAQVNEDGSLSEVEQVAGGPDESIFQPSWSPAGELYFVSERTGWWNLYRRRHGRVEAVTRLEAEFGLPQWTFGLSTYAFESAGRIICAYTQGGVWHLASLDTEKCELKLIETPYTEIYYVRARAGQAVFLASSPSRFWAVVQLDLGTGALETLRQESQLALDQGYLSVPEAIEFPTEQGLTAHAFFYAPQNRDYKAPPGELPPLLVISHGGPTGASSSELDLKIQYWTSRGLAVLDVNYGGSTGYGRSYRQRLDGQWGVVDVADCANGVRYLVAQGRVDGQRLAIRGGSAGGYTTLAALTFLDLFQAGASYYGISDLEAMAQDTHKFESRYLERLVGPYPERRDLFIARSPIHAVERLSCPVILFQGLEDRVVLPNQSEMIVAALRAKEIPVAYLPFAGEQHGFRQAEAIKRSLEAELYFYSRIFGFELAEPVEPVMIENL